jgi:riboflavin synthase
MFTGIVQGVGHLRAREQRGGDQRLTFELPGIERYAVALGGSVAINGCCLTAVERDARRFGADVSLETLRLTNLGGLALGAAINYECALRAGDALGGHLMSGHVDGLAEVVSVADVARSLRVRLRVPAALARYIARKGSVALDGVSLTVNDVAGVEFEVNLVPHTQAATTFASLRPGQQLNLEVDVLARYLERLKEAGDQI